MSRSDRVGSLVRRVLGAAGVDAVFGRELDGLDVTRCPVEVAEVFALAHRHVHGGRAAIHVGDGVLRLGPPAPRDRTIEIAVASVDDLLDAIPTLERAGNEAIEIRLLLDPAGAVAHDLPLALPPARQRWQAVDDEVVDRVQRASSPAMLVGPEVSRQGGLPGLHALAAAASLGVLNTFGAKGVFNWQSRHHLATVGLQELDFELGGLAHADLILVSGLDPLELAGARWELAPTIEIPPDALGPLSERWARPHLDIIVPPLRTGLARLTQQGWAATASPLSPTRVTMQYASALGSGGLLAADPGVAGYWVARTFATTEPGAVQVPASAEAQGFSAACVVVARLRDPYRPALAVCDDADLGGVQAVLEAAGALGVGVPMEVWTDDGDRLDADAHLARLRGLVSSPTAGVVRLGVDQAHLAAMVEVAGPITAWGGLG